MSEIKDFQLTMKLRNNQLRARRLQLGLSPRELAEKAGVNYALYLDLEGLRKDPLSKRGDQLWTPSVLRLSEFHGERPESLFPAAVLAVEHPQIERELAGEEVAALAGMQATIDLPPTPEYLLGEKEEQIALARAIDKLSPQHRHALLGWVEGRTLRELGDEVDLHGTTISVRIEKALRQLRSGLMEHYRSPMDRKEGLRVNLRRTLEQWWQEQKIKNEAPGR